MTRRCIEMGWVWIAVVLLNACGDDAHSPPPQTSVRAPIADAGAGVGRRPGASKDASVALPKKDPGPPKRIFAKKFVVKVRAAPSKQALRIGYMRAGSILMAKTAEPVGYDKCRKGWYELETGGFICSTVDAIPFLGSRLPERRATQPDLSARLPYPYGYARRTGTPVYRRLPTDEEAAQYEGYVIPGRPPVADAGAATAGEVAALAPQAAGAPGEGEDEPDEPEVSTLESLLGDPNSVLQRRMERGFYVSVDREMDKGRRKYWRTQSNGFIPHKRLLLVKGSEFSGVDLKQQGASLPLAFVMSSKHFAYTVKGAAIRRAGRPGYHHRFQPVGEVQIRGRSYLVAADGRHYRADEVRRIEARTRPEQVGEHERWIDVDLATQSLVAYEGDTPVYATLVSTGRVKDPDDPLKNFETPTGSFRLTSKHLTATMDGDHAVDGPYSIEDVPYVMYFQLAYAFHAAFWHNSFGRPRSHGCINLAPDDARYLFQFASPTLPTGWHGVYPTDGAPGTQVFIHGQTPEG